MYQIPNQFFLRLHHPRPRFKTEIEDVLIYLATEITAIGKQRNEVFKRALNNAIRRYGENITSKKKTVDNWRTEIDALFGFIIDDGEFSIPSKRAVELATQQDLVKFFKLFCYHFQYPGGFVKPKNNLEFIKHEVDFKPVHYILNMLNRAEQDTGKRAGINKAEATHCIFNDLRVTRDNREILDTWKLIMDNREVDMLYNWKGDAIRYAGDILDYAVQANLLVKRQNNMYYINHVEDLTIQRFLSPAPSDHFDYYAQLPSVSSVTLEDVKKLELKWVEYFNTDREDSFFDTDILALISDGSTENYEALKQKVESIDDIIEAGEMSSTGVIGSVGESLIIQHERIRISNEGRPDLKHLIKLIPPVYAVGYDINSVEADAVKRLIEVKTTASPKPVDFKRFHLTPNEWDAAKSYGEKYYVYRLMVTKGSIKLRLIKDPIAQYKLGNIDISVRDGVDVTIDPSKCGQEVELLR
ncbi:protein NO VEIN domain-containing protein [Paenibacillus radicis (ex Gao et al. 2016)]|uniref:Restriction endonuclease n=1 Tax=Paenibacillus radicis (ex Gao et al. 2016) TaxID=1737354 RepID=A0A917GXE3_9BACL|nr:DUF3883 domain-containing protein [Paenibacillus radicis (ex Gao et al. 2016)]GGG60480.1 restriction endonuclease [Paenibacillus radicis (ex Gao et al. 2016)]